jgi:tetratricopeptide (TPR) repeat protein
VLDQLKVRGRKDPKANIFQLLRDRLCDMARGPWLVILDNADDARVLLGTSSTSEQADKSAFNARLDCIPPCNNGQLLVTSRTAEAAKQLVDWNDMIVVEPMGKNQALTLLCNKLGTEYTKQDALQLARELDFMPLALTQAAAYIRQSAGRCTIRQYLEKLKRCDASDEGVLDLDERDLRRDRESSNSIMLTWQVTFDHIREIHPSAADLLSLMSFFHHQAIPENLLHKSGGGYASSDQTDKPKNFDKDLAVLRSYFFVTPLLCATSFQMHKLVQLATKKWLKAHGQFQHWSSQFISNLNETFPLHSHELENWGICQSLFPHAIAVLDTEVTDRKTVLLQAELLLRSGRYAMANGDCPYAQKMLERSYHARKDMLGESQPETLTSMSFLAMNHAEQGQCARAQEMWQEVLERRKEVLGTYHPDTLASMSNLATALASPDEAEALQLEVLEKSKSLLGEEHESTWTTMNCLAGTYSIQGRYEEAERLYAEVIEKREKTLGELHPSTLRSKGGLASTFSRQGRHEEAGKLEAELVQKKKAVLGEDHPSTLLSMDALSWEYMKQGRWEESEELQLTVIEKRKMVLVQGHPLTRFSMVKLAILLKALGRPKCAIDLVSSCLELSTHMLGPDHEDVKEDLQFKAACEADLSSQAGTEAPCDPTDRPAGDGAGIVQSVRNMFAAMKLG